MMKFTCSCCRYSFEKPLVNQHIVHAAPFGKLLPANEVGDRVSGRGAPFEETSGMQMKKKVESDKYHDQNSVTVHTNTLCTDCYNDVFLAKDAQQT